MWFVYRLLHGFPKVPNTILLPLLGIKIPLAERSFIDVGYGMTAFLSDSFALTRKKIIVIDKYIKKEF